MKEVLGSDGWVDNFKCGVYAGNSNTIVHVWTNTGKLGAVAGYLAINRYNP